MMVNDSRQLSAAVFYFRRIECLFTIHQTGKIVSFAKNKI